jgi:hypothetical protein
MTQRSYSNSDQWFKPLHDAPSSRHYTVSSPSGTLHGSDVVCSSHPTRRRQEIVNTNNHPRMCAKKAGARYPKHGFAFHTSGRPQIRCDLAQLMLNPPSASLPSQGQGLFPNSMFLPLRMLCDFSSFVELYSTVPCNCYISVVDTSFVIGLAAGNIQRIDMDKVGTNRAV